MSYLGTTKIGKMYLGSTEIAKAYLGTNLVFQNGPVIPDGPVDWIEADGTAYINSNINGNITKGVMTKVLLKSPSCVIGSRKDSGETRFFPLFCDSQKLGYGYNYFYSGIDISSAISNSIPVLASSVLKNGSGNQVLICKPCDSGLFSRTNGTATVSVNTDKKMFILANNNYGTAAGIAKSGVRLYFLRIYSDAALSSLLFDGIPYKNNGEYGLFDRVSNSFFGNANSSGMFKGGFDSPVYTEVDYIQTDGTAFIDTGIFGSDPRSMKMKYMPASATSHIPIGIYSGSEDTSLFALYISSGSLVAICHNYFYSSGGPNISNSITNQTPFEVKAAYTKGTQTIQVKQEGESSYTTFSKSQNTEIETRQTMYLFAAHKPSDASAIQRCPSGSRLYSCKIYSDVAYTNLVFDGVPCIYNNEYGLWDKVSNSFFGNAAGSGAFTGPQI